MSLADFARERGLKRMGARPPFFEYLRLSWLRRDFAIAMSIYSNQAALSKTRLGRGWLVLGPTLQAAIYGLIFGVILGDRRPENFIPYMITGVFLFSFFSGSFSSGAAALTSNRDLVRSLSFPRLLLPISAVIRQFINLLPQLALLAVILLIWQQPLAWSWFEMIPILLLMTMFSLGLAMIAARLTVQVRDISKLIPFITRLVFYTSGIFFELEKILGKYPELLALASLNPVYDFISLARGALVVGYDSTPQLWAISSGWAVLTLLFGLWYFWRAEERYGRD